MKLFCQTKKNDKSPSKLQAYPSTLQKGQMHTEVNSCITTTTTTPCQKRVHQRKNVQKNNTHYKMRGLAWVGCWNSFTTKIYRIAYSSFPGVANIFLYNASAEHWVYALFPPASKASDQSKHRWAVFNSETLDLKKIYMQNIVKSFLKQPINWYC